MSLREASGASKSQSVAFAKTQKNMCFLVFLYPEASQENLKRFEKAPKRHPKRHPKVVQKLVKKLLKLNPKMGKKKQQNDLKKSL